MSDLILYIFNQEKEGELHYTFVLEEPDRPPLIGNRTVPKGIWNRVLGSYDTIAEAVGVFMTKLALPKTTPREEEAFSNTYKEAVSDVVERISDLLGNRFWPDLNELQGEAFASRFAEVEKESSVLGNPPHLLIATNDSKIPWWLTPGSHASRANHLLCETFALGMVSLRANQPHTQKSVPDINIRIITCPTLDLAQNSAIAEIRLEKAIERDLRGVVSSYKLLSGRDNDGAGLDREQVKGGFKEGRIVLYHGHFNLNTNSHNVEASTVLASGSPINRDIGSDITIEALGRDEGLSNKDIIFIGCETAGMHPKIDETLGEYLAKRGSTLVGTLYPILDEQARSFANELSKALFLQHFSWGESVRRAREAAKDDGCLFYRAAYCYFGVPWQMSPLFAARRHLFVLVPKYLESVYRLIEPQKVYSSIVEVDCVDPARLEEVVQEYDEAITKNPDNLFIAALPSVFVAELLQRSRDWIVLGPMVASDGDVRVVAAEKAFKFKDPNAWVGKRIVFKGPHLAASAFLKVWLRKMSITIADEQWRTIPTDCAPVVEEGLAELGLIVAREDLSLGVGFPGEESLAVDKELAEVYDGEPIPRILWVTKRVCTEGWRRFYIEEFFKRLCDQISEDNKIDLREIPGSTLASTIRLYRTNDKDETEVPKQVLARFLRDWAELDQKKERRSIADEDWYVWSANEEKPRA